MASAFTTVIVLVAIVTALACLVFTGWRILVAQTPAAKITQGAISFVGGTILFLFMLYIASFRPVPTGQVAVINKKMFGSALQNAAIIATNEEMGIQDEILRDGWHSGFLPFIYELEYRELLEVPSGHLGIITTIDGAPLPRGEMFAPAWEDASQLLDATTFLNARNGDKIGYKGQQTTILLPGKYAYNFRLYNVETVEAQTISAGQVGVIKSNIGAVSPDADKSNGIVPEQYRGIWAQTFPPGVVPLNPNAYEIIKVPTTVRIVDYSESWDNTDEYTQNDHEDMIVVKTRDGYIFPVDVRVEYRIEPTQAPEIVAQFYSEKDRTFERQLRQKINSTVRSVFRNNAETAIALDYINERSQQESQSLDLIRTEMEPYGVTILRVAIGDIDPNEESPELAALLKTQTDRQLAIQEEITYKQQQAAAREQQKLNDEQQRALEIKRLATADFDDQIAEREAARTIKLAEANAQQTRLNVTAEAEGIQAKALAEAHGIRAKALAEAEGYQAKALAVGGPNLAMIELFERISNGNINITPDIIVGGGDSGQGSIGQALGAMIMQRMMQTDAPLISLGINETSQRPSLPAAAESK